MILDEIKNKGLYLNAHPLFEKAFAFIEEYRKKPLEQGTYEICGDNLFARVQEYDTREDGLFEVHNRYIDIQYIAEGKERIAYGKRNNFTLLEYDEEGDFLFLEGGKKKMEFVLSEGEFVIFFPEDAHKPSLNIGEIAKVKKVVIKVKV